MITALLGFFMVSSVRFRSFKDMKLNLRSALLVAFMFLRPEGILGREKAKVPR